YTLSDGALTDTATVNVTVTPADDVPVGVDDAYTATEDRPLAIGAGTGVLANDTGLGDGGITLLVTAGPGHGAVALNDDGSFVYTPNAGYSGVDSFTYQITDADGDTATATVSITISPAGDAALAGVVLGEGSAPQIGAAASTPPRVAAFDGALESSSAPVGDLTVPSQGVPFQPIPRAFFGWLVPPSILEEVERDEPSAAPAGPTPQIAPPVTGPVPPPQALAALVRDEPSAKQADSTLKVVPPATTAGVGTRGSPVIGALRPELEEEAASLAEKDDSGTLDRATALRAAADEAEPAKAEPQAPETDPAARAGPAEFESSGSVRNASFWLGGGLLGLVLLWTARRSRILATVLGALPGGGRFGVPPPARDDEEEDEDQPPRV
ncbi:MAG: cadherin-like domain-containing protein, partial [Burkholderiales bacterium]|nr:cadherin-like domain-containing protein [Burkholderiales bacterium]